MKKTDPPQPSIMPELHPALTGRGALLLTKTCLLVLVFVMVFHDAFSFLVKTWAVRDDYSFGFLVPLISALLIYANREQIRAIAIRPAIFPGIVWMCAAALPFLLGRVSGGVLAQELSVPLFIPGIVLTLFGSAMLRTLAFPLAYLFLMVPFFDFLIVQIQYPFQILSASMSAELLQVFQIDVLRQNQYLRLPHIVLEVAPACSGLNYLVSIFAIALPLAFFTQKTLPRKLVLVAAALIIGVSANIVRITLIGMWSVLSGTGPVHGPLHVFQGMFVSIVGFAGLFLASFGLSQLPLSKGARRRVLKAAHLDAVGTPPLIRDVKKFQQAWSAALLVLCCIGFIALWKTQPVSLRAPLEELPGTIETWKGMDCIREKTPFVIQGADESLFRVYRNKEGSMVRLFIGYFASQDEDKKIIDYRSEISAPGGSVLTVFPAAGRVRVNKRVIKDNGRAYAALSFYFADGRPLINRYEAKLRFAVDGLIHRRTNGAVVVVWREIPLSGEAEAAFQESALFLAQAYPLIHQMLL